MNSESSGAEMHPRCKRALGKRDGDYVAEDFPKNLGYVIHEHLREQIFLRTSIN